MIAAGGDIRLKELRQGLNDNNFLKKRAQIVLMTQGRIKNVLEDSGLSDEELIKIGREDIERQIKGLEPNTKQWHDWSEKDKKDAMELYIKYREPDNVVANWFMRTAEQGGFTLASAALRGALAFTGGLIGGPGGAAVGGYLGSWISRGWESLDEGGEAFMGARYTGKSLEEAYKIGRATTATNLGFLTLTDGIGDIFKVSASLSGGFLSRHGAPGLGHFLTWVSPAGVSLGDKIAGNITGNTLLDKVKRAAAMKGGLSMSVLGAGTGIAVNSAFNTVFGRGANNQQTKLEEVFKNSPLERQAKELDELKTKIDKGEIKPDDVVREDPIVFLPKDKLTEEMWGALGLKSEVREIVKEDTGEVVKTEQEEMPETENEVAVRKSDWDKFAEENPEKARELEPDIREGTRGVTAREEYETKFADMLMQAADRLNMPTVEAQQARNIVSQIQDDWKSLRGEVGFDISDEVIETESLIYGHYLLSRYAEYGFASPEEFHRLKLQNGEDPIENALNQLMYHGEWAATEFKAYGIHMSENADSVTVGEDGQNAGAVKNIEGPEQSELIDYHENMSSQPEGVRSKIQMLINDLKAAGFNIDGLGDGDIPGKTFYVRLKAITKLKKYRDYAQTDNKHADQLASELLGRYGVPGMSYWHEKPTKKKAGVRNFIIWDTASFKDTQAENVQAENNNIESVVEPEVVDVAEELDTSEVIEEEPEVETTASEPEQAAVTVEVESENEPVVKPEAENRTVVIIDDEQGAAFIENDLYDELVELVAAEVEKSRRNITISAILRDYELRNEIEAALNEEQEAAAEIINTVASEAENVLNQEMPKEYQGAAGRRRDIGRRNTSRNDARRSAVKKFIRAVNSRSQTSQNQETQAQTQTQTEPVQVQQEQAEQTANTADNREYAGYTGDTVDLKEIKNISRKYSNKRGGREKFVSAVLKSYRATVNKQSDEQAQIQAENTQAAKSESVKTEPEVQTEQTVQVEPEVSREYQGYTGERLDKKDVRRKSESRNDKLAAAAKKLHAATRKKLEVVEKASNIAAESKAESESVTVTTEEQIRTAAAEAENPRTAKTVSEAAELIRSLGILNTDLNNSHLGITATISKSSLRKMESEKATAKSVSPRLHALAVANVDKLFTSAVMDITHDDTHNRHEVEQVRRLGSVMLDPETGEYVPVMLTAIEYREQGRRIYTVEAVDVVKYETNSAGQSTDYAESVNQVPITEFVKSIANFAKAVNEFKQSNKKSDNQEVSTRRGYIDLSDPTKAVLGLTKNADASTFLHEIWHMSLADLLRYGNRTAASEQVKADRKTAMEWLGITEADFDNPERMRTAQEDWAHAGEMYFMTGKAPTKQLQGVFQRIRAWMLEIYDGVRASLKLNRELTADIEEVFDRLLALDEDITLNKTLQSGMTVGQLAAEEMRLSSRLEKLESESKELEAEIKANGYDIPEEVAADYQAVFLQDGVTADVAENIRRGTEAMNKVITEQVDVMDAMYRDDVGNISFIWGTPGTGKKFKGGKGIAHIIAHRNEQGYDGQAIARKLVEVIAKGYAVNLRGNPGGERIDIIYGGYTAVLSLYNDGQRQTWLLTGWKDYKNTSVASSEGDGSSGATLNRPMLARPEEGAEVLNQSLTEDTAEVNGETDNTPEWLDAEAARDVEGWLKAWGAYEVRRDEYQNLREGIRLIKELGGLRFQDFVNVLGRELAVDLRSQWSGLFRNIHGKIKLPLDQLMQSLEDEGLRFEYADDFINWLEKAAQQQPKRPAPLIAINTDTLYAFIDELGFDGAKDYIDQRRRYLKALQQEIQAKYDYADNRVMNINADIANLERQLKTTKGAENAEKTQAEITRRKRALKEAENESSQIRADLEATYKEQRENSELLKRFDWAFTEGEPDMPEWLADTSWLDDENDNQAKVKKRKPQPENLTLSEALKKGYELAEKYSREAYNAGVKAGREVQRTKDAERIANLKETQKERIAAEREKADGRVEAEREKSAERIAVLKEKQAEKNRALREKQKEQLKSLRERQKQLRLKQKAQQKLNKYINRLINEIERAADDKKVIWHVQQEIEKELEKYQIINEITLTELIDLHDKIKKMQEDGRRELAAKRLIEREKVDQMRNEIYSVLEKEYKKIPKGAITGRKDLDKIYPKGIKGKLQKAIDYIDVRTLGAQRFFSKLDGGKNKHDGGWSKYFLDMPNASYDEELRNKFRRREWIENKMRELGLKAADLVQTREVDVPIVSGVSGTAWTVDDLMSIYAGMKNPKNRAAILYGNFAQAQNEEQANEWAAKCVQALTAEEKAFADAIIEEYEMNFDRINQALIEAYNRGMNHEERYTPMRRLEVNSYGDINTPEVGADMVDGSYETQAGGGSHQATLGHVPRDFAQGRKDVKKDDQKGIDLGLFNIWNTQMEAQEHAAAFVQPVRLLRKVLTGRTKDMEMSIQQAVKRVHGKDAWNFIKNYFYILSQNQTLLAHDALDGFFGWLGKNMSRAYLCINLGTCLKQTTSFPRFLPYCGLKHMLNAIREFAVGRKKFLDECYELDPQLKARSGNVVYQSMRTAAELGKYGEILDMGMKPIEYFDKWTSAIGWKAVYDANIANGKSQNEAVREAYGTF